MRPFLRPLPTPRPVARVLSVRWAGTAAAALTLAALALAACGGGGSSSPAASTPAPTNVAALSVDSFPPYGTDICGGASGVGCAALNQLYVTLKVCPHGSTSNCQTIDHVVVDTGSIGLRLLAASLMPPTSAYLGSGTGLLAAAPTISYTSAGGTGTAVTGTLAECQQFGGGYSWGSVRNVDVTFVGTSETATNVPMQVMGDMEPAPASCVSQSTTSFELTGSGSGGTANPLTYPYLGGNGLIGISLFAQDCGSCTSVAQPPQGTNSTPSLVYAVCTDMTGNNCTPTTVPLAQQVVNPVAVLPSDNNGYIISMPAISASGAVSATGTMTLGIGTHSNNALGSATQFQANPNYEPGFIYTTYNGAANQYSIFDSGSSLFFFADSSIALCGTTAPANQYYCPGGANAAVNAAGTTLNLTATVNDYNNAPPGRAVPFSINNLNNFTSTSALYALDNIGGTQVFDYFIWGMPSFYGKTIYFGLSDSANNYATPYYAF